MADKLLLRLVVTFKGTEETHGYTFPKDCRHHGENIEKAWRKAGHKVVREEVEK